MMILSAQTDGQETSILMIESCMTRGFAGIQLIGNISEVCKNGLERAKNVLEQMGIAIPNKKIVINVSPGDVKKNGTQFDLAFAINLYQLITAKSPCKDLDGWLFIGELGLNGEIRAVKSVVSCVIEAVNLGLKGVILPDANYHDVRILLDFDLPGIENFEIIGFSYLSDVIEWAFVRKEKVLASATLKSKAYLDFQSKPNFDDMVLSEELELLAQVIAVGGHSILLYGTPGTGKSMFAHRITSIMPRMSQNEHMDALRIMSICSEIIPSLLLAGQPPLRAPHHQASSSAVLGTAQLPGELSLAHGGVLFLDEFAEFRRDLIESLREPLETGEVRVSRAQRKTSWKAKICLIAATNNCPCGWFGSQKKKCKCPINQVFAYRRKISGPIIDRIDLHFNMPEITDFKSKLFDVKVQKNKTQEMRASVCSVRGFSESRNRQYGCVLNAEIPTDHLPHASGLDFNAFTELVDRMIPKNISNRGMVRIIRVARTLADLQLRPQMNGDDFRKALGWNADQAAKKRGDELFGF